jgi:hypothetical protein
MPLIDAVADVCRRLETVGWCEFLLRVSDLNIRQPDPEALVRELSRPLQRIDRSAPGFRDFALEGKRAIEPGAPAHTVRSKITCTESIRHPSPICGCDRQGRRWPY